MLYVRVAESLDAAECVCGLCSVSRVCLVLLMHLFLSLCRGCLLIYHDLFTGSICLLSEAAFFISILSFLCFGCVERAIAPSEACVLMQWCLCRSEAVQ